MHFHRIAAAALLLVLTGCEVEPPARLGDAFVAPAALTLRRDLTPKSATIGSAKHGDHLSVMDIRRRWVKVRTDKGLEGWVDSGQLLSKDQMEQLRLESARALALPAQATATVYEALNIHNEPDRLSPAFAKVPEGASVEVLAHKIAPKTIGGVQTGGFSVVKPPPPVRRARKAKDTSKNLSQRPPMPPAPKVPDNLRELSAEGSDRAEDDKPAEAKKPPPQAQQKPVVMESWSLIRTKDKQVGWVLARNLMMSIPDEVAQYAEGKRITAFFDLGSVNDEEKGVKHNWLWTTASETEPFDFDGFRVFLWNRRRHRYETSFRQREVEGYFPVQVAPAEKNSLNRDFALITKDDDNKLWQRHYAFDGTRVRLTGKEPWVPGTQGVNHAAQGLEMEKMQAKIPQPGWIRRQWNALREKLGGKK